MLSTLLIQKIRRKPAAEGRLDRFSTRSCVYFPYEAASLLGEDCTARGSEQHTPGGSSIQSAPHGKNGSGRQEGKRANGKTSQAQQTRLELSTLPLYHHGDSSREARLSEIGCFSTLVVFRPAAFSPRFLPPHRSCAFAF